MRHDPAFQFEAGIGGIVGRGSVGRATLVPALGDVRGGEAGYRPYLAEEIVPDSSDPRSLALFQISFYGFLQECLV